jgi:hypothetical protein
LGGAQVAAQRLVVLPLAGEQLGELEVGVDVGVVFGDAQLEDLLSARQTSLQN